MSSDGPSPVATVQLDAHSASAWCAARLEQGSPSLSWRSAAARAYAAVIRSHLARPLVLPLAARVLGVGSATLGGAGKTPVAVQLAADLRTRGDPVAFVGHAYRAHPQFARMVSPDDDVRDVGDDALVAANALHPLGVPVWVAPSRNEAVAAAARHARTIVVDGLLQARPTPLFRSLLVLDARAPFGSGSCPPAGDLRGAPQDLVSLCDEIVLVRDPLGPPPAALPAHLPSRPARSAWIDIVGALDPQGTPMSVENLRSARVGLLTLVGRAHRVLASLAHRGIVPACHWTGPDHGSLGLRDRFSLRSISARFRLDGWLVTPKCRPHLSPWDLGAPLWTLDVRARLDPSPQAVLESGPCAPHVFSLSC